MEVMKAGYLKKNISTNTYTKQYKKFYFVLKRDREISSKKTLEYFKDQKSCVKKEPKGVCNLYSQYNVHTKLKQERKFIFEITELSKSHELMTTDETTGDEWVKLLAEGLVIQIFIVIKMCYPPTAENYMKDIKGAVQLKIDDSYVTLLSNNGPAVYWEMSVIRKCKMNNGLVILEVGNKSKTGEGEFYFNTSDPKRLYHALDRFAMDKAKKGKDLYETIEINQAGKMKPNNSTYKHLSYAHNHLAKASIPPASCNDTYDLLSSSIRMVTQQRFGPKISPILNNTKPLSDKSKITMAAVNNHDTNKTNKAVNVEPNDSTYDHLSHVSNHLTKASTPPPINKSTYDSLFSSRKMASQRKSDLQIASFLNNTKHLSCKTGTSSEGMPPATPTILESTYVQMDPNQTIEIQKPIPPLLRSIPATQLPSMGFSLNSEVDLLDNLSVGKFNNPTLRSKEESTGASNTKNTSTSNNDICDDSSNTHEVVKEPYKFGNNNNKENRNSSLNEYNRLFEHTPKEVSNKLPEYNHFKRNSLPKPSPRTNKLSLQESPVPPLKNEKKPLRPVRPPVSPRPLQKQQAVYENFKNQMNTLDYRNASYNQYDDITLREHQANITSTNWYMEILLSPKSHSVYDISIE